MSFSFAESPVPGILQGGEGGQQDPPSMCPGGDTLSLASLRPGLGSWNLWGLTCCQPQGQEGPAAVGAGQERTGCVGLRSSPPSAWRPHLRQEGPPHGTAGSPDGGRAQSEVSSRLRGFLYQPPFPPPPVAQPVLPSDGPRKPHLSIATSHQPGTLSAARPAGSRGQRVGPSPSWPSSPPPCCEWTQPCPSCPCRGCPGQVAPTPAATHTQSHTRHQQQQHRLHTPLLCARPGQGSPLPSATRTQNTAPSWSGIWIKTQKTVPLPLRPGPPFPLHLPAASLATAQHLSGSQRAPGMGVRPAGPCALIAGGAALGAAGVSGAHCKGHWEPRSASQ